LKFHGKGSVVAAISELRLRCPSRGAKSTCTPLALLGKRPQLVPAAHASVADSLAAAPVMLI
jgi:hypothetical protein